MDVNQINTTRYSHIHFAFIDVTKDFKMDTSKVQKQFDMFKKMTGVKKIASFGGWDFSTLPGTFQILRQAVLPANRATFVANLAKFAQDHNLDGIDLDWEYPGVSFPSNTLWSLCLHKVVLNLLLTFCCTGP
jgi:GH18 family chitinase